MKKIGLVVYDLDRTLWTITDNIHASKCTPPFIAVTKDSVEDSVGHRLTLKDSVREVIVKLKSRSVLISLISANDFSVCEEILVRLGIKDFFIYPQIEWENRELGTCDKRKLMLRLVKQINFSLPKKLKFSEVLFIDDRIQNVDTVKTLGVNCFHFGVDIKEHKEVLEYI